MALTEIQQIKNLIENCHYCLLIFNAPNDIDSIASALAIEKYLRSKNKQIDIVCPNFLPDKKMRFLENIDIIKSDIMHSQKFTIKVDVSRAKLDTLSYDIKDGWLSIHLNPISGIITKNELRTAQSSFKYDVIITVNIPDLESLKSTFINNTDLFYRLPIINIDHNIANEYYGQINLVEISATAGTEIIYNFLKEIDEGAIKDTIATYLLSGIISKTKSFKAGNITPHTLNIAGRLMELGAKRDEIIKHLFYHHSLSSLKIWGKALSCLQHDPKYNMIWTSITRDDLVRSGASNQDLDEVIDEMLISSPEAEIIVLLSEEKDSKNIIGLIITTNANALNLVSNFNPQGNKKRATIKLQNKTLKEAEEEVIKTIKGRLG